MTEGKKSGINALIPDGKLERVKLILTLLLSIAVLLATVCYAVSCISIYRAGGSSPYSREIVGEYLTRLLPLTLVTVALAIAAGVVSLFTAEAKIKNIPLKSKVLLGMAEKKLNSVNYSDAYIIIKETEATFRRVLAFIEAGIILLVTAFAATVVLDPSRYSVEDVNSDVAYSAVIAAVGCAIALLAVYVVSRFTEASYKKEYEYAKEELHYQKTLGISPSAKLDEALPEGHTVLVVRLVIIAVAVLFIILGIVNGGMADVLGKAVRICTECIGLG